MGAENGEKVKVTILLSYRRGEHAWSARVPGVDRCLGDGGTPKEATDKMIELLEATARKYPDVAEEIREQPEEYLIPQVEVNLPPRKDA